MPGVFWVTIKKSKTEGFFGSAKKGPRDFFGYAKKSSDFFKRTNSEVLIFLGIKYEPLSDPPIIKICGWSPGLLQSANVRFSVASRTMKRVYNSRPFLYFCILGIFICTNACKIYILMFKS